MCVCVCVCVKDEVAGVRRALGVHHRTLPGRRLLRYSRLTSSSILLLNFLHFISNFMRIMHGPIIGILRECLIYSKGMFKLLSVYSTLSDAVGRGCKIISFLIAKIFQSIFMIQKINIHSCGFFDFARKFSELTTRFLTYIRKFSDISIDNIGY